MSIASANGLEVCYETFGNPSDPPLLLVMGLGAQMIAWDEEFCRALADRGFHVVRFDNRDSGLSSKIEGGPVPNPVAAMGGDTASAAYRLSDMARDAVGLLDALGIAKAHIVGASMGGMIVQTIAINHPDRVLSMASIMSTTGGPEVGRATPEALAALLAPRPTTREEAIEAAMKGRAITAASPGFPFDEAKARAFVAASYDRSNYPIGMARQLVAIMASGDRTEGLKSVKVPTVVIHGEADVLVTPSGGHATAAAIPGAKLVTIPGMGHALPPGAWPVVIDAIVENTQRA
jgi:pimeloyl-ACP methyl ester carboxylesterase